MLFLMEVFMSAVIGVLMIVFHELGHIGMLFMFNGSLPPLYLTKRYIEIGDIKDYIFLNKFQYNFVLISGILTGFIPFVLLGNMINLYLIIIILFSYWVGCQEDLKNIINA